MHGFALNSVLACHLCSLESLKFREEAKAQHWWVSDSSFGLVDEFFKVPLPLQAPRLMSQGCAFGNFRCRSPPVLQLRRDKSRINNYSMGLRAAALIYLLLLVDKADSEKGFKCGGILSASSGNISSPNFPSRYPYNSDCSWLIVVAEGSSVHLTFHHFELEHHASCSYDYIKIYNGVAEDEGNLLGAFCGDVSPPQFTSSWNVMSIIFHSDRHVAYRGFSVGYRKDMCGGVLTGLSGEISSPGYPLEYNNNADCTWTIRVSNASLVTLVFLDFQLENNEGCNFDFVALFDGPTVTHRHLGNYCGADKPPRVVTTSNNLLVAFKSDFNIGGRGFKAYYYSGECQQVLVAVSGTFSSPRFPNIYPNNINCHWGITQASGYRVKLFFPFLDLEERNSLSGECDYDSVTVYDGDSQADPMLGRWCGGERPPSLVSRGNKLLVVLSTDRNEAHRGFTAAYLGGKCSPAAGVICC
ncbi:hypothetical protein fugu_014699 [Takifugu bimaculatus]|uniref:CUB domain-containing protein n=1 Tax=Takifugu bimaculatus TaxID=433685 RepID=A0A4Z2C206_9TELE|nr:hypothetical protein fugu_014699 [Takifugu bimaculatus]